MSNGSSQNVMLIPYECGDGASTRGSGRGPKWLETYGLAEKLSGGGRNVVWHPYPMQHAIDEGELPGQNILRLIKKQEFAVEAVMNDLRKRIVLQSNRLLSQHAREAVVGGYFPVTVGGDHSMVGSFAAVAKAHNAVEDAGILWVDAHADFNTPDTSYSGSLHGMSLAVLTGLGDKDYRRTLDAGEGGRIIRPEHICLFGVRDVEDEERELLKERGIRAISMEEINRRGISECFDEALEIIGRAKIQMLSFDVDSMDALYAPATGTPVSGGFDERIFTQLARLHSTCPNFVHAAFAEFNPTIGTKEQVSQTAENLTRAAYATLYGREM